ncbi:MAG: polysaccharide deacetylase family protein, partial [Patescibacteria group bacterium]|nr:polysaccharide deacetylase family protein [Patescibacteria group bacterium]
WGTHGDEKWEKEYLATRQTVDKLLKLLDKYKISATWAFVGQLFLEGEDKLLHAPDMAQVVKQCPTFQEIGCHSFTHPIMDDPNFKPSDMDSELSNCVAAAKTIGLELKSFVYPQNRVSHTDRLSRHGFICYRGKDHNWYSKLPKLMNKIAHVVDEYLLISPPVDSPIKRDGVWEIPGGYFYPHRRGWARFLPISFRSHKAISGLYKAARQHCVFHLWTHPFNLASDQENLLQGLETIFQEVARLRDQNKIQVMTMSQVATHVSSRPQRSEVEGSQLTKIPRLVELPRNDREVI